MQYYSRAGLFALLFTLIVSLVSAVPIPSTESTSSSSLSSRKISNLIGQDRPIELDAGAKNPDSLLRGRMSTLPLATKLTSRQFPTDTDEQLVRRSKIGDKIKHAFQKAGGAIKKGFQKVGQGIKTAANKVGNFVKTTGAKVAKFGLKVVQSWEKVGSKVLQFVPGIGKPLSKVAAGISRAAGAASDAIKVKLPPKLQKGMNVMNKANKVMGYMPREFSEEEGFQERDIDDAYHFQERDDIALENREESYSEVYGRDIYERYDLD